MIGEESYEDRFDGMEFEVRENGKLIGIVVVFQHWFKPDRKAYPKIGDTIKTEKFDFLASEINGEGGNIEYDSLKIVNPSADKN
jgi:hypothetical protein